jgi:hypothetical protein
MGRTSSYLKEKKIDKSEAQLAAKWPIWVSTRG